MADHVIECSDEQTNAIFYSISKALLEVKFLLSISPFTPPHMLLDEPPIWTKWQTIDLEERSGNYFSPTSTFVRYCTTILSSSLWYVYQTRKIKTPAPALYYPTSPY